MKNKNSSGFRLYFIVIELMALLASIGTSVFMGFTASSKMNYEAKFTDVNSFYNGSDFDLLVSGASREQIDELKSEGFVIDAAVASKVGAITNINDKEADTDFLVFESLNDIDGTEFNKNRLLHESHIEDGIYADYRFCQENGLKLGDKVGVFKNGQQYDLKVSKIYRTDYLYSDGVLAVSNDVLPMSDKSLCVYLKASSKEKLIDYLQDYKPLGTLLEKTPYQTEEDYQRYLNDFYSKDYYSSYVIDLEKEGKNQIENLDANINSTNKTYFISVGISSIVCLMVSLLSFFLNAKTKKDRIYRYIQENGNSKILKLFTVFGFSFVVFSIVSMLISLSVAVTNLSVFYTYGSALATTYLSIVLPAVSIMVGYTATAIAIKKA